MCTTGERACRIALVQRALERTRDRAALATDRQRRPVLVLDDLDHTRITAEPPRGLAREERRADLADLDRIRDVGTQAVCRNCERDLDRRTIQPIAAQIALCERNQGVARLKARLAASARWCSTLRSRPDVCSITSRDSAESPSPPPSMCPGEEVAVRVDACTAMRDSAGSLHTYGGADSGDEAVMVPGAGMTARDSAESSDPQAEVSRNDTRSTASCGPCRPSEILATRVASAECAGHSANASCCWMESIRSCLVPAANWGRSCRICWTTARPVIGRP